MNVSYGNRETHLRTAVDGIAAVCGSEVVVFSYRQDGMRNLFHGHPSVEHVLQRFYAPELRHDIAIRKAIHMIDLDSLPVDQLLALKEQMLSFSQTIYTYLN